MNFWAMVVKLARQLAIRSCGNTGVSRIHAGSSCHRREMSQKLLASTMASGFAMPVASLKYSVACVKSSA